MLSQLWSARRRKQRKRKRHKMGLGRWSTGEYFCHLATSFTERHLLARYCITLSILKKMQNIVVAKQQNEAMLLLGNHLKPCSLSAARWSQLPGVLTLLWYSSSALLSCSNSCLNMDAFSPSDFDILPNCIFAVWSRRLGKGGKKEGEREEGMKRGRRREREKGGWKLLLSLQW